MAKTKLYLQGSPTSSDDRYLQCPLSSTVIVYFIHYCEANDFELVFVSDGDDSVMPCHLSKSVFSDIEVTFLPWSEVPNIVRNVSLPSLQQPELSLVRSGLCVVLRHIIKESHATAPHLHLIDLLGFRQGSMKMCAEVSGWTKLCEVDLPHSASQLISKLKGYVQLMQRDGGDGAPPSPVLPNDLIKLECHFQKKCLVHNDNKKRAAELVRLKKHLSENVQSSAHLTGGTKTAEFHIKSGGQTSSSIPLGHTPSNTEICNVKTDSMNNSEISYPKVCLKKLAYEDCRLQIEQEVILHHGIRKVRVDKKFDDRSAYEPKASSNSDDTTKSAVATSQAGATESKATGKTFPMSNPDTEPAVSMDIMNLVENLTQLDIEYVHTYSEGIEMTLADLILFVYVYHMLEALDFNCSALSNHIPRILEWGNHMTSLAAVIEAGQRSGWDMRRLTSCLALSSSEDCNDAEDSCGVSALSRDVIFVKQTEEVEDPDDMELSRFARMKHKAIKPEVLQALKKFEAASVIPVTGSHPCGDGVQVDWDSLPPGVHPKEGDVPVKRTQRKCQQLENLVTAVQSVAKPGDILVDFCSGGGHLGIVMAYLLPDCQVYLVENKEESLLKACSRLESLNLSNVTLYQCNLDYFVGKFDVGVCLHACGSATDMVLQLCLNSLASFVICPCCYGSIQKTHLLSYPRSQQFLETNITYKDFLTLGHAADQTEFSIALEDQGRHCMNLVDTDRAQYARELGYTVTLCSLKPLSCTPKNNLLIGTPT